MKRHNAWLAGAVLFWAVAGADVVRAVKDDAGWSVWAAAGACVLAGGVWLFIWWRGFPWPWRR